LNETWVVLRLLEVAGTNLLSLAFHFAFGCQISGHFAVKAAGKQQKYFEKYHKYVKAGISTLF
jgi:hypothetical protein